MKAELAKDAALLIYDVGKSSLKLVDELINTSTGVAAMDRSVITSKVAAQETAATARSTASITESRLIANPSNKVANNATEATAKVYSANKPVLLKLNDGRVVMGDLNRYVETVELERLAVISFRDDVVLAARAPGKDLQRILPNLWADETGAVFRTTGVHGPDKIPQLKDLQFVPNYLAVTPERLNAMADPVNKFDIAAAQISREKIIASSHSQSSLLDAMQDAPLLPFNRFTTSLGVHTAFNPTGARTNCMSCTAGIFRTLTSGRMTTAPQVELLKSGQTTLGFPTVGRFADEIDAFKWFTDASGAKIGKTTSTIEEMAPNTFYASKLGLAKPGQFHMTFAYKFKDGTPLIYDGQNGIRLRLESLNPNRVTSEFLEMKLR